MHGTLWTALIASLMLLMLYRRFKSFGRPHPVRPLRMLLRVGIWSMLAGSLALLPWVSLPLLAGAAALGIALAVYALTTTEFVHGEKGLSFRPNTCIGAAISVLFAARILWRLIDRFLTGRPLFRGRFADPDVAAAIPPDHTPITFVLLFIVLGYYVCYTVGVLIRARRPHAV